MIVFAACYYSCVDKQCCTCRETLPISEFYPAPKRKDGLTPRCVACVLSATAASDLKLKMETVEHLGGRCRQCGYHEDHRAFVIDHVNGDGAEARRSGVSGRRLLRAALSDTEGRFQLLCWNCNTIKRVANNEIGNRTTTRRTPPSGWPDKRCPKCLLTQPVAAFYLNRAAHDGLTTYCAACTSSHNQSTYHALRHRAVEHHGGKCKHCGYDADERALAFDHVAGGGNAERKATSSNRRRALLNAVLSDAEGKFQLLCSNCNHIKRLENAEGVGNRVVDRNVPTVRLERPDRRGSAEIRALRSATWKLLWEDPEFRARESARRSAALKARWASGEVPNRRKTA